VKSAEREEELNLNRGKHEGKAQHSTLNRARMNPFSVMGDSMGAFGVCRVFLVHVLVYHLSVDGYFCHLGSREIEIESGYGCE